MLKLKSSNYSSEAGTDEAGRGCLAGPVTAAAVIFACDFNHIKINDSKQLSLTSRLQLRTLIENEALAYSVQHVFPEKIDEINILNASIKAMHLCLDNLSIVPEFISVDGNKFHNYKSIPHQTIIKGDSKYLNIAAASILAKTYRDDYMIALHDKFPEYGWATNKGYPTKHHRDALKKYGLTPHHRKSFKLMDKQFRLGI